MAPAHLHTTLPRHFLDLFRLPFGSLPLEATWTTALLISTAFQKDWHAYIEHDVGLLRSAETLPKAMQNCCSLTPEICMYQVLGIQKMSRLFALFCLVILST
ncbi:hypothetical protein LMS44_05700 [Halomonas profundus]|uniref:hypothetical protein n=1 Tax=Vreelandella titanicae TaxID=664683 RepID=UPI0016801C92|nr:hypothetical protein [Halomonas titanicae]QNU62500.1 hypothetical protein HZS52_22680 [Halomonas titanicae]UEQ05363.1 hypothetical protein LMS44_05700 [Halomonas profundus]|tara:strand:- start:166 stop:471 length:306 start_codon:yes stop_codon:yes gene_type:complete